MIISRLNNNININKINGFKAQKPTFPVTQNNSADKYTFTNQKSDLRKEYETIKSQQGLIGKLWDGFKNIFGMKSGSKHLEKILTEYEKGKIDSEKVQEALKKYEAGQKTCVDVVADMASGILAIGAFALAVPTGGASLAIGLGAATLSGSAIKIGIKAGDALATGKEYKSKDLLYDTITGGINGLMGPVTNGLGNCVTKTIGKKLGLSIIGESTEQIAKQGIKSAILNQSIDVAGGTIFKRAIALGSGMALDGALGGASDNMVRAALNGEDIAKAGIEGAIGGMIMAPVIGGSFRVASKAGKALNNKITTKILLPDGLDTKFKQGKTGDCALLSTIDGIMNNPKSSDLIKKSITKTPFGDYNVKIGNTTVKVAKSALSDEILSDNTGIRIFEQAYKQLTGDIDGGFADIVAKQFGLNPIHITGDGITDEILDKIAKEHGNTVLSLGTLVDSDGFISPDGAQRHYFTIKNIDAKNKTVKLTSPVDTSKTIELSYDDIKKFSISIDGGSINKTDLPNTARLTDDIKFKGIDIDSTKSKILQELGVSEDEFVKIFTEGGLQKYSPEKIAAYLDLNNIKPSDFTDLLYKISLQSDDIAKSYQETIKVLEVYSAIKENPIFGQFHLSLDETHDLYQAVLYYSTDDIYKVLEKNNPIIAQKIKNTTTKDGKDIIASNLYDFYRKFTNTTMTDAVSPENIIDLGIINGQRKRVLFPNATSVPKATYVVNADDLIKSNMITTDIIDIASQTGVKLPETVEIKIKRVPNVEEEMLVSINPMKLIERVNKFGIDNLSSHEIHALTDMFSDIYKKNNKFAKALDKYLKQSKNVSQIYNYVQHLKTLAAKELRDGKVKIEDHAFMRMLDRNLVTVTDNNTSQLLSFEQFIKLLKEIALENGKGGKWQITGINGFDAIEIIVEQDAKGKLIIDSIM